MRSGASQSDGSDESADSQSTLGSKPRRCQLHARRVDTCHESSGKKPQRKRRVEPIGQGNETVGDRRRERAGCEKLSRLDSISQGQQCRNQGSDDESNLNRHGEPHRFAGSELPLPGQVGRDCGGTEPDTHRKKRSGAEAQKDARCRRSSPVRHLVAGRGFWYH